MLLDGSLEAVLGPSPQWLPAPFDWNYISRFGSRIGRVEQLQARTGHYRKTTCLVAVIGMSAVREDLDANILHNNDPADRSWLILGVPGR